MCSSSSAILKSERNTNGFEWINYCHVLRSATASVGQKKKMERIPKILEIPTFDLRSSFDWYCLWEYIQRKKLLENKNLSLKRCLLTAYLDIGRKWLVLDRQSSEKGQNAKNFFFFIISGFLSLFLAQNSLV